MDKQEIVDQNTRLKQKNEQLMTENKDVKNQIATQETRAK